MKKVYRRKKFLRNRSVYIFWSNVRVFQSEINHQMLLKVLIKNREVCGVYITNNLCK